MRKKMILVSLILLVNFITGTAAEQRRMQILVYPFAYMGDKQYSWIAAGMTDTVISDLNKIKDVSVFTEADRQKAVKEMELGMTGLIKESDIVKVGNIMGANMIFIGSLQVEGGSIRVNAKLVNVETSNEEKTIKIDGTVEGIFKLQDRVVFGLMAETEKIRIADIRPVHLDADDRKKIKKKPKPKSAAYEWYAKGLEVHFTNPHKALEFYLKAISIDSGYYDALFMAGLI